MKRRVIIRRVIIAIVVALVATAVVLFAVNETRAKNRDAAIRKAAAELKKGQDSTPVLTSLKGELRRNRPVGFSLILNRSRADLILDTGPDDGRAFICNTLIEFAITSLEAGRIEDAAKAIGIYYRFGC